LFSNLANFEKKNTNAIRFRHLSTSVKVVDIVETSSVSLNAFDLLNGYTKKGKKNSKFRKKYQIMKLSRSTSEAIDLGNRKN